MARGHGIIRDIGSSLDRLRDSEFRHSMGTDEISYIKKQEVKKVQEICNSARHQFDLEPSKLNPKEVST